MEIFNIDVNIMNYETKLCKRDPLQRRVSL